MQLTKNLYFYRVNFGNVLITFVSVVLSLTIVATILNPGFAYWLISIIEVLIHSTHRFFYHNNLKQKKLKQHIVHLLRERASKYGIREVYRYRKN